MRIDTSDQLSNAYLDSTQGGTHSKGLRVRQNSMRIVRWAWKLLNVDHGWTDDVVAHVRLP